MEQQTHKEKALRLKEIQLRKQQLSENAQEYLALEAEEAEIVAYAKAHAHRWLIESGED